MTVQQAERRPLIEYWYYAKAWLMLKVVGWIAHYSDPEGLKRRGPAISKQCGGREHSSRSLHKWDIMVQAGKGENIVWRALRLWIRRKRVGSKAPDGVVHLYGSLEPVKLSSFLRPGRMTLLNFGSYT